LSKKVLTVNRISNQVKIWKLQKRMGGKNGRFRACITRGWLSECALGQTESLKLPDHLRDLQSVSL
jgi:hypothetical protein